MPHEGRAGPFRISGQESQMSATKGQPLPAILIANDLREGHVVFRTAVGWTRDPARARVASDQDAADVLATEAVRPSRAQGSGRRLSGRRRRVERRAGPRHFRERFRTLGPSIHPDLGKQAEFAAYASAAAE